MGSMNPSRFPAFLSVGAGDYGGGLQHYMITIRWNFPTGKVVPLTDLVEGQEATALQLPAQPDSAAEAKG
jgi:hypothetical protein